MQELDDTALLRQYTEQNSEEAFAALVTRHVDKVYSVALRHTRNPHQAEEITQAVFVTLAKKARHFGKGILLSGWLYQAARLTAVTFIRSEIRRAHRNQEAYMQTTLNENEPDPWIQIAPLLDAAIAGLNERDRNAVVLRFFDGCSMSRVGAALGASEEAAKKRVNRAVEKLRIFLSKRGVALPAAALIAAIATNSVQAAPVGLAGAISGVAVAQGATASGPLMAFAKGLLKPALTLSAGMFAAFASFLGSTFFHLKAEVEHARSPRERQFLLRMIWLRFSIAFLITAVPIGIALVMPAVIKQPGVVEYGFAGYFYGVAIAVGARTLYFHRRRRQIQIEDGTWQEFDPVELKGSSELLADLRDTTSNTNRYSAIAAIFGLLGCFLFMVSLMGRMVAGAHWIAAVVILLWFGFASFRWIRNWRQRPLFVFDPRFGRLAKVVACFGVYTLLLLDLSWARGRLPQSNWGAIGSNIAIVLAYVGLIGVLARSHRRSEALQDSM